MKTTHTPDTLTQASLAELTAFKGRPCLSLYEPTHRRHPENQQDPVRFGHLVKALETSLPQQMATEAKKALLAPFHALAEDRDFWNHTQDGLAVLSADGLFRVFMLQQPVAVVADSFHTKPLRQRLQSTERYQVLALGLHKVQLFEGDRHALDRVALAVGVPQMPVAELVDGYTGPPIGVSFDGGSDAGDTPVNPAHGGQNDDTTGDTDRFFRAVDRAVLDHHSRPSSLPLLLAALPEHHHRFREISHNPFLMATGLMVDPHGLTHETLVQRAWEVAAPQQKAQQAVLTDAYAAAAAQGLGRREPVAGCPCRRGGSGGDADDRGRSAGGWAHRPVHRAHRSRRSCESACGRCARRPGCAGRKHGRGCPCLASRSHAMQLRRGRELSTLIRRRSPRFTCIGLAPCRTPPLSRTAPNCPKPHRRTP